MVVVAGLGSGLEGCHPLFLARGSGGGREDGCGRRSGSRCFSWRWLTMARAGVSLAPLSGYGGLLKGFIIPGTDTVNVKGKNMTPVTIKVRDGGRESRAVQSTTTATPAQPTSHLAPVT